MWENFNYSLSTRHDPLNLEGGNKVQLNLVTKLQISAPIVRVEIQGLSKR